MHTRSIAGAAGGTAAKAVVVLLLLCACAPIRDRLAADQQVLDAAAKVTLLATGKTIPGLADLAAAAQRKDALGVVLAATALTAEIQDPALRAAVAELREAVRVFRETHR
jgi:hypothetical protein